MKHTGFHPEPIFGDDVWSIIDGSETGIDSTKRSNTY